MKRWVLCCLVLMSCNRASAADELAIDLYRIDGNSVRSIRSALDRQGPLGEDGKRYHGYTKWHVSWTFNYAPTGGSCTITSVGVDTDTVMTLPEVADPHALPDSIKIKWDRYSAALKRHEDGHREFALAAARDVRQRLSRLRNAQGCKALENEANRLAQAILSDVRARERDYDRSTDHGATQGARF